MSRFTLRRACWLFLIALGVMPAWSSAQEVPPLPPPEAVPPDLPPVSPIAVPPYVPRPEVSPADRSAVDRAFGPPAPEHSALPGPFVRRTSFEPPPVPKAIPLAANPARDEYRDRCTTARGHQANRAWAEALREAALAARAFPEGADAYRIQAEVHAVRYQYAHAVAILNEGLAACPTDAILWALRGAYRCIDRDRGGLADLDQAARLIAAPPKGTIAWVAEWRAGASYALGDYADCLVGLAGVAPEEMGDPDDLARRGDSARHVGDLPRALADLEWAAIRNPSRANRRLLAFARLRAGRVAEALGDLERLAVDVPADLPVGCVLGLARLLGGRRAEGVALLDQLGRKYPDDPLVNAVWGWTAFLSGNLTAACDRFDFAAGHEGGRLMFHANLAADLGRDPNADWAVAEFERRCRVAPALPWAIVWRTDAAARHHAVPGAVFSLAVVSRLVPDPAVAPTLIVQLNASFEDQPWRGAAILGEFIAAAGLRDRAKLGDALGNLEAILRGHPTVADAIERLRRDP